MNGVDKQFLELGCMPVLQHTLTVFEKAGQIAGVVLVVAPEKYRDLGSEAFSTWGLNKLIAIVPGGNTRQQSVFNGLLAIPFNCRTVLVHDGARPLITVREIESVAAAADEYGAATLAVPVKDTVKEADGKGFVARTPKREMLWLTQTPQGFSYQLLMEAHRQAGQSADATDDATLVEAAGHPVKLVPGSYRNIKITTPEDIYIAEALIKAAQNATGDGSLLSH
jgi:2-C-methyl-D-erythritol 4-phosphate cytidylyltransferase